MTKNKMDDNTKNIPEPEVAAEEDAVVADAKDSPVTEAPAENPFAGLKAEADAADTDMENSNPEDTQKDSESSDMPEDQKAGKSEESASEDSGTTDSSDSQSSSESSEKEEAESAEEEKEEPAKTEPPANPNARWYVVHTFAGHENKVATALRQRIEAERLENLIFDILVPTQDKIEIKGGKKETVKEKIFPGYILIKMELSDLSWLAVRTTQGVTSFIGAGNKPTPISEAEVATIVKFTTQGASPTFKDVFMVDDTVKIIDGPFAEFIGKVDSVDKEKGRVRVLVSIFGRETPVELDFLQVQKL